MKLNTMFLLSGLIVSTPVFAASTLSNQYNEILENAKFAEAIDIYTNCVMKKGREFLATMDYETAVEFAPRACRRELLQIKQLLLSVTVDVNISEILLPSIAESVEIDLINNLLGIKLQEAGLPDEPN